MKLEEYFDFFAPDDIRIKGTRVGIESVLYEYIHRERNPEAIAHRFPSLTLEQIYATILFYLRNKTQMDDYMSDWLEFGQRMRANQKKNPPPVVIRLRNLKQKDKKALTTQ